MANTEWKRPCGRDDRANKERAFLASSKRRDRSLADRIKSALQASAMHYDRTGRCLNITAELVAQFATFEELDEKEDFFNPSLLLPAGVTVAELWKANVEAMSGGPVEIEAIDSEYRPVYMSPNCPDHLPLGYPLSESSQSLMEISQSSILGGIFEYSGANDATFRPNGSSAVTTTQATVKNGEDKVTGLTGHEHAKATHEIVLEEFDFDEWLK